MATTNSKKKAMIRRSDGVYATWAKAGSHRIDGPVLAGEQREAEIHHLSAADRPSRLDEVSRRVRHHGFASAHLHVKLDKRAEVLLDGEVPNPPHALAEDPYDGTNIVELHAAAGGAEPGDHQAGSVCGGRLPSRVASRPWLGERAEEMLDQLVGRCWADVLCEVLAAGNKDAADLFPVGPHRVS